LTESSNYSRKTSDISVTNNINNGKNPVLEAASKDINESQRNKFEFESYITHTQTILYLPHRKHTVSQIEKNVWFVDYEKKDAEYPNVPANGIHNYHWDLKC
jgi:hypothetical protein